MYTAPGILQITGLNPDQCPGLREALSRQGVPAIWGVPAEGAPSLGWPGGPQVAILDGQPTPAGCLAAVPAGASMAVWDPIVQVLVHLTPAEGTLAAFADHTPLAVVAWDARLRILDWNRGAERMFGLKPAHILGKDLLDTLCTEAHRSVQRQAHQAFLDSGEARRVVQEHVTVDGRHLVCEWHSVPLQLPDGSRGAASVGIDVTERTRAEGRLRSLENDLRSLFDNAQEGIFRITPSGRFVYLNPALARMCGFQSPEDLLEAWRGMSLPAWIHAVDRFRLLRQLRTYGQVRGFEFQGKRHPSGRGWYLLSARRVEGAHGEGPLFEGFVLDISEQKAATKALEVSEARLMAVVSSAPVILLTLEAHGQVTLAQGQELAALGLAPEDFQNRSVDELGDAHPWLANAYVRAMAGDTAPWTFTLGDRDYQASVRPLTRHSSQRRGWILALSDITSQRQAERSAWSEEKLRSLIRMAGGIAHDFNNLFQSLQGHLEVIQAGTIGHDVLRHHGDEASLALHRAINLSHHLLQFSGGARYTFRPTALEPFLHRILGRLATQHKVRTLPSFSIEQDLPEVPLDASAFEQALAELYANAEEAMEGPGRILISARTVRLAPGDARDAQGAPIPAGRYVVLDLSDNGIGMAPEVLEHIFEPFFSTKFTGRGLGLPALLGILQAHRAAIQVASVPGEGTTMRLFLPTDATAEELPELPEDLVAAGGTATPGMILVADDEPSVRMITCEMLELLGYTCIEARDGREALERFQQHASRISLVILDMTMPVMDGATAFRYMLAHHPQARIIIASGYSQATVWNGFPDQKPLGFLQKPFGLEELRQAMGQYLPSPSACR